jgi:hypothetical protein
MLRLQRVNFVAIPVVGLLRSGQVKSNQPAVRLKHNLTVKNICISAAKQEYKTQNRGKISNVMLCWKEICHVLTEEARQNPQLKEQQIF